MRKNRRSTAKNFQGGLHLPVLVHSSNRTVGNRLHKHGTRSQNPLVGSLVIAQDHRAPLAFVKENTRTGRSSSLHSGAPRAHSPKEYAQISLGMQTGT